MGCEKKIIIGITGINPFIGNRGVGALALSTLNLLQNLSKEKNLNLELVMINYNSGNYVIDVGENHIKTRAILPVSFFNLKSIFRMLVNPNRIFFFLKYLKIDLFLCMGEGDSFSDIYGKGRFKYINNQHRMARLLGKKYVLLPQTIGPFQDSNVKKQAIKSIEKADLVFARDSKSYQYVKEHTRQKNVFEAIDVAFLMPYKKQSFSQGHIHIGINISSLLWNGGYTRNNQFGLKSDYQKLIINIIDYFISVPDTKVHLVPHVVKPDFDIENDYEVSYNIVNKYANERILLAPFFLTPIYAKNYISGLDFFAGARMHATIAAFSSGVPVFPMAYSRKFNGLFAETLDYEYIGDMVNQDSDSVFEKLKYAFENRKELFRIIQNRLSGVVKERERVIIEKLSEYLR